MSRTVVSDIFRVFQKFKRGGTVVENYVQLVFNYSVRKNWNYRSTFVTWYSLRGTIGFNGTISGAYVTWSLSIKCRQNSRALNAKSDRVWDKVPHKIKESSRKLAERLGVKDYYYFFFVIEPPFQFGKSDRQTYIL